MRNEFIRSMAKGVYDIQKLRMQCGARVVVNFKAKMGMDTTKPEDDDDTGTADLLKEIRSAYALVTDGVVAEKVTPKKFKGAGLISTYAEFCLVRQYIAMMNEERKQFLVTEKLLREVPIYSEYLEKIKGCGTAMSAVLISEIDIHKAKYPSSLWKYAGLDVASDGRGRSRKAEHLVKIAYTDKEGVPAERNGITFNPFLKTKLYVLGTCLIKANNPEYRKIYDDYKHRLESNPAHADKSKGHRNNMAIRYMLKMFLLNLHIAWRKIEGLPVSVPYQEAKLGHRHEAA